MAKKGETKTLVAKRTPAGDYYRIEYEGGGTIPTELEGLWTSSDKAEQAILRFDAGLPIVKLANSKGTTQAAPQPLG